MRTTDRCTEIGQLSAKIVGLLRQPIDACWLAGAWPSYRELLGS